MKNLKSFNELHLEEEFSPVFHAPESKKSMEEANEKAEKDIDELLGDVEDDMKDVPEIKKAIIILETLKAFSKSYNQVFHKVETDLFSPDHKKIKDAYEELMKIYPHEMIRSAGILTVSRKKYYRMIKGRISSEWQTKTYYFLKRVDNLIESVRHRYEMLKRSSSHIGKSDKQRAGYGRLAAAGRMKWAE